MTVFWYALFLEFYVPLIVIFGYSLGHEVELYDYPKWVGWLVAAFGAPVILAMIVGYWLVKLLDALNGDE